MAPGRTSTSRTPRAHFSADAARPSTFVVTVHDVVPRTRALAPLYRRSRTRVSLRSAAVIVHSRFAADMLVPRSRKASRAARGDPAPRPAASNDRSIRGAPCCSAGPTTR